jgi:cytochrome c551
MKKSLLAIMLGAVLVLGACGGGNKADNNNAGNNGTPTAVDAEKIINNKCIQCHGGNLQGQGNAPGIATIGGTMTEADIHDVVVNGKGTMPPVLKGDEADAVAKYLANKK